MEYREFRGGLKMPVIGLGSYLSVSECMRRDHYIAVFKKALEVGYRMFDTAEAYNCSEEVIGNAISGFSRGDLFIVSKVWPTHASFDDVLRSARASVRRLGTFIDLYLLHWPSRDVPISETIRAFERLIDDGLIRFMGVSNFDAKALMEAMGAARKYEIVANEVKYNLADRFIERDLMPMAIKENIAIIAYSPLGTGSLLNPSNPGYEVLRRIAAKYGKTPAQVALNWLISKPNTVAIPKATREEHLRENLGALGWRINQEDQKQLEQAYPIG
ncbi:aldo/keto reductase [Caldivirga sp.]|uniref:aldo/keto reductase n=1 Tax=Caldivirga sp. TaxID=2080243 RepID=UPI0025BD47C3|nr:aldo/keto reductase [Caldivirga sp.]